MDDIFSFLSLQWLCPLCVRCGSFQVCESFFCKTCEDVFLKPRLNEKARIIDGHCVRIGLHWKPYESDSLSEVAYLLKSRWSRSAWFYYSQVFEKLEPIPNTVIVPVPGRQRHWAFHTQYFAQALGKNTGYSVLNCLLNQRQKISQKKLNLVGRSQSQFQFIEEFTRPIADFDRVLLIDDIITSGHTLKACKAALEPHLNQGCQIDIIALLSREKI